MSFNIGTQATELIHGLEDRRDSFTKLQKEGRKAASFLSYEDLEDLEQIKKWTTTKV